MKPNPQPDLFPPMSLTAYMIHALRTESPIAFLNDDPDAETIRRLLHAAMGVSGEVAELFASPDGDTVNLMEESGDLAWFLAVATNALNLPVPRFIQDNGRKNGVRYRETLAELVIESGNFLDLMKKWLFYGRKPSGEVLAVTVFNLWSLLARLTAAAGLEFSDVLAANVEKLKARYPVKFDAAQAVNRDLKAERAALEGAA